MVFAGGTFRETVRFPVVLIQHVILLGACWWASLRIPALWQWSRGHDRALLLAGIALLALVELRAVATAYLRFSGPAALACAAGAALIVITLSHLRESAQARRLALNAIGLIGGAVATVSIYSWASGDLPRASDPLGHHNLMGAFFCLVLPVQVTIACSRAHQAWERWSAGGVALITSVALVGSESLGSAAGILVALPVVPLVAWLVRPGVRQSPSLSRLGIGLAVVLAALTVAATTDPGQRIGQRMVHLASGAGDRSGTERVEFAKGALEGVLETHPVFGFGTAMTPFVFPLDLRQRVVRQSEGVAVTHLHSTPVQITYELGLLGLLLTTLTLALAGRSTLRRLRLTPPGIDRSVLLAALGGGIAYAVRCLTDVNFLALAVPYTACLLLGLALAVPQGEEEGEENESPRRYRRIPARNLLSGLITTPAILLVPMLIRVDLGHRRADAGLELMSQITADTPRATVGRLLREASAHYQAAHQLDPKIGFYAFEAGLLQEALGELEQSRQRFAAADQLFADAMLAVPTAPGFALHLGALRLNHGDFERAEGPLNLAAAVECRSAFALPLLARWRGATGDVRGALELFREVVEQRPICICAEDFYQPPIAEHGPALLAAISTENPELGALLQQLYSSCSDDGAIIDRPVFQRMDDQNPWKARSLYLFRRRGLATFSAPFEVRSTAESMKWNRTAASMALHARIASERGPVRARDFLDERFPRARALLPPEAL